MNKDLDWCGFHTDHDFASLWRLFTGLSLPPEEKVFLDDLLIMFPNFFDIKLIAESGHFRGGLTSLSEILGVERDDDCEHQAGSDSKITAKCFNELKKIES